MGKRPPSVLISLFRGCRLVLHLLSGVFLAIFYPRWGRVRQCRTLQAWSRQLLDILNVGIRVEGLPPARDGGFLIVANHVSWLDIFVLNAIHPSRFIAKSEVKSWPLIGWLCQRSGTIFIERSMRRDAASSVRHVALLLKQGACVGLFPEGTTTDGMQVGHFHSAFIQPAIDAGARLYPIALHYLDDMEEPSSAAVFIGDTTLAQSVWRILRCRRHSALTIFTPALAATENRRVLARAAQEAIARELRNITPGKQPPETTIPLPMALLSSQSGYALLLNSNLADD